MLRHLAEIKGDVYSNMTNNACIMEGKHFTESPPFTPLVVEPSNIKNINNSPLTVYRWCKDGIASMETFMEMCLISRDDKPYMLIADSDVKKGEVMAKGFARVDKIAQWTAKKVKVSIQE